MKQGNANTRHLETAGRALRLALRDYPRRAARPRNLKRLLEAALDMVAKAEKEMLMGPAPEPTSRETPVQRRRRLNREEG